MGVIIVATTALSVAANVKSADQVSGTYQFAPFNGYGSLVCRGSATGLNVTLVVGGVVVVNDQPIPYTGTAGALSVNDHRMLTGVPIPRGSRTELSFRNTTGGSLTVDSQLVLDGPV